jgi:hypothetical protein
MHWFLPQFIKMVGRRRPAGKGRFPRNLGQFQPISGKSQRTKFRVGLGA